MKKILWIIAYVIILTSNDVMINMFPDEYFFPDMHKPSIPVYIGDYPDYDTDVDLNDIRIEWDHSVFMFDYSDDNIHYFEFLFSKGDKEKELIWGNNSNGEGEE